MLDYGNINRRSSVTLIDLFISSNKNVLYLVLDNTTTNIILLPVIEEKKRKKVREGENNTDMQLSTECMPNACDVSRTQTQQKNLETPRTPALVSFLATLTNISTKAN